MFIFYLGYIFTAHPHELIRPDPEVVINIVFIAKSKQPFGETD